MSSTNAEREDEPCPICLRSKDDVLHEEDEHDVSFVFGPACGHVFCLPCIERLLLAPPPNTTTSATTPTLGTCPICRTELSYFDLLVVGTKAPVVAAAEGDPLDPRLFGAVFVEDGSGGQGWGSYHFPSAAASNDDSQHPYLNCERIPGSNIARLSFSQASRYHAATHTWEGKTAVVPQDSSDDVLHDWRVLLTFSDNFQHIARGVMIRRNVRRVVGESGRGAEEQDSWLQQQQTARHCLDGRWLVRDSGWNHPRPDRTIEVTRAHVQVNNVWHRLRLTNEGIMLQAIEPDTSALRAAWDWSEQPEGPIGIGSRLVWKNEGGDSAGQQQRRPVMEWTRETQAPPPSSSVDDSTEIIPLGGNSGRTYRRVVVDDDGDDTTSRSAATAPPSYHAGTVWGNTFCQGYRVGLASYHFVRQPFPSESDADGPVVYISYEDAAAVAQWPPLDNGLPIPARVRFRNISFPDPYTFRGHICWLQDYSTSWQGMIRWEYEMKFDTEFMCIVSGVVKSVIAHDDGEMLAREMSRYGESLLYCNAALFDEFRRRSETLSSFQLHRRLVRQEGASEQTWLMILNLFLAAEDDGMANPIEFG